MAYINQAITAPSGSNGEKRPFEMIQYGPIFVRVCRKTVPTLKTGRCPRNFVLVGEAATKREQRRQKNRESARKLSEKRRQIAGELSEQLQELESQYLHLQKHVQHLHQRKETLQSKLNEFLTDNAFSDLLFNTESDMGIFMEQYSNDLELLDGLFDPILCSDFDMDS